MHVLIPAGGRGSRLRPLTDRIPKPLLPLGDRPILSRIVEAIPSGVEVTVLVTQELEPAFQCWRRTLGRSRPVRIYVERPRSGGPAGPVTALAECVSDLGIREDLVVTMGDCVHPFRLETFVEPGEKELRIAIHQLARREDACRFGVVEPAADGTLRSFEEKPARPRSSWIFTGCLYLPARLLPTLPALAEGRPPQMGELVAALMERGERVNAFQAQGEWHDIGTVASYLAAHARLLSGKDRSHLLSGGNQLEGVVYVHPTARVTGARLKNCLVFAGARVADAELTDCVVSARTSVAGRSVHGMLLSAQAEFALQMANPAAIGQ